MSTRSLTRFFDEDGKEIVTLYRQSDGYPECMGRLIANFLKDRIVVNGYSTNDKKVSNGMNNLVCQFIHELYKHRSCGTPAAGPGNFYLYPAGLTDAGEEYVYEIYPRVMLERRTASTCTISMFQIYGDKTILHKKTPKEFLAWIRRLEVAKKKDSK